MLSANHNGVLALLFEKTCPVLETARQSALPCSSAEMYSILVSRVFLLRLGLAQQETFRWRGGSDSIDINGIRVPWREGFPTDAEVLFYGFW